MTTVCKMCGSYMSRDNWCGGMPDYCVNCGQVMGVTDALKKTSGRDDEDDAPADAVVRTSSLRERLENIEALLLRLVELHEKQIDLAWGGQHAGTEKQEVGG